VKSFVCRLRNILNVDPGIVGVDDRRFRTTFCTVVDSDGKNVCMSTRIMNVDTKILSTSVRTSTSKNFYVDTEQLSPSTPITNIDSKTISYVDPENPWQSTPMMQTSTYKTTSSLTHKIFGVDTRRVVVPLNQHLLTYNASYPTHSHTRSRFTRRFPESEFSCDFMATCKCDKISPELQRGKALTASQPWDP